MESGRIIKWIVSDFRCRCDPQLNFTRLQVDFLLLGECSEIERTIKLGIFLQISRGLSREKKNRFFGIFYAVIFWLLFTEEKSIKG